MTVGKPDSVLALLWFCVDSITSDMPYEMHKTKGGGYAVSSPTHVHAKHATKANAKKQMRLLNAIEHDPGFKPRKK